jgi:hypothetical protein
MVSSLFIRQMFNHLPINFLPSVNGDELKKIGIIYLISLFRLQITGNYKNKLSFLVENT